MRNNIDYIDNIRSIKKYKTCTVFNDRFLNVDFDHNNMDIFNDIYKFGIKDIYYDDSYYKDKYDEISNLMDDTFKYYMNLQDRIEEMGYPEQSFYIMIINISKIYHLLDLGRYYLDKWFNSDKQYERDIIVIDKNESLIDIEKCNYESIIPILVSLYNDNFLIFDDLFKYELSEYEMSLFLCLISIVPKISCENCDEVIRLVNYVDITYDLLLKKYKDN